MSARGLALAAWIVTAALSGCAIALTGDAVAVAYGLLAMALATTGVVVLRSQPRHRIGWLFCVMAVCIGLGEAAGGYGQSADGLAGEIAEWFASWLWILQPTLWAVVIVLFPDGHLAGRRWRIVPWLALGGCVIALPGAFSSATDSEFESGENPFAIDSAVLEGLLDLGLGLVLIGVLGAGISLAMRLRRARGVERQQLKWFAFAASLLALTLPFVIGFWNAVPAVESLLIVVLITLPTTVGIAILRHRLYDIDVVINRALVYATLTASAAASYVCGVLVLQLALSPLTQSSNLAIAGSTIAVAALFQPARRRIQTLVDRRFFRSRYDAQRTLERFGAQVRDEVDLDALGEDLRAVVAETMAPEHIALWLREGVR